MSIRVSRTYNEEKQKLADRARILRNTDMSPALRKIREKELQDKDKDLWFSIAKNVVNSYFPAGPERQEYLSSLASHKGKPGRDRNFFLQKQTKLEPVKSEQANLFRETSQTAK